MPRSIPKVLLSLFVVNLGIVLGAGLYESRIIIPQWMGTPPESVYRWNAEAARRPEPGRDFWAFVTTVPLTLLTLANLMAAWRVRGAMRVWWLGAAMSIVVERILTFLYFIPRALKLQHAETLSEAEVVAVASQWPKLNYVRHAFTLAGWLAALKAFSLLGARGVK